MARRPPPGKCTYCLRHFDKLTWDHVLPLSWYPSSTPHDIAKWKAPACTECNRRLGQVEEDLLLRLGLCLEPQSISALGISHKAIRAISPQFAKDERGRKARELKRQKLLGEAIHFETPPQEGFLPHFGPLPWLSYDGYHAVLVREDTLRQYAEKLVRGMALVLDNCLLGPEYKIDLHVVRQEGDRQMLKLFDGRSQLYHRGLGFVIRRMVREDDQAWMYAIHIWERLRFYVVAHPGDLREPEGNRGAA
jgi:hypothetical protein